MKIFYNSSLFIKLMTFLTIIAIYSIQVTGCGSEKSSVDNKPESGSNPAPVKIFPTQEVMFTTGDGVRIVGTFMYIDDNSAHPGVILCHQFRADRSSYAEFQKSLAANGLCSLAIDFRGFGGSEEAAVSYKNFSEQDYQNMLNDIKAALIWLQGKDTQSKVDGWNIGLVGASIGANLAIMAGGADFEGLKAAAAISPGRNYKGLVPIPFAGSVEIPMLIAYTTHDRQSAEVIPDLKAAFTRTEPEIIELSGQEHGTEMFRIGLHDILVEWLKENLSQTG